MNGLQWCRKKCYLISLVPASLYLGFTFDFIFILSRYSCPGIHSPCAVEILHTHVPSTLYLLPWDFSSVVNTNRKPLWSGNELMSQEQSPTSGGSFSVTKSCPNLCDPMDCSMPDSSVLHYLLEFAQILVCWC